MQIQDKVGKPARKEGEGSWLLCCFLESQNQLKLAKEWSISYFFLSIYMQTDTRNCYALQFRDK